MTNLTFQDKLQESSDFSARIEVDLATLQARIFTQHARFTSPWQRLEFPGFSAVAPALSPFEPRSFPDLDETEFGLMQLDLEIWMGLAELLKPIEAEMTITASPRWCHHGESGPRSRRSIGSRCATSIMKTTTSPWRIRHCRIFTVRPISTSPSSTAYRAPSPPTIRMPGGAGASGNYFKIAPEATHLPEHLRKAWIYYGIFPNNALSIMPESVQFYQEFPLSTGETLLRCAIYRYPDESREQAAARYLAYRIDRDTMNEEMQLSVWSNESMVSEAFEGFYLSDLEYGVRTHHDHLRKQIPVLGLETAPEEKDMWALNDALGRGRSSRNSGGDWRNCQ